MRIEFGAFNYTVRCIPNLFTVLPRLLCVRYPSAREWLNNVRFVIGFESGLLILTLVECGLIHKRNMVRTINLC